MRLNLKVKGTSKFYKIVPKSIGQVPEAENQLIDCQKEQHKSCDAICEPFDTSSLSLLHFYIVQGKRKRLGKTAQF